METVTVRIAFEFTCPKCRRKGFVSAVVHEFAPEEQAEAMEQLGETAATGDWLTHPETVQCAGCKATFRAANAGELVGDPA